MQRQCYKEKKSRGGEVLTRKVANEVTSTKAVKEEKKRARTRGRARTENRDWWRPGGCKAAERCLPPAHSFPGWPLPTSLSAENHTLWLLNSGQLLLWGNSTKFL